MNPMTSAAPVSWSLLARAEASLAAIRARRQASATTGGPGQPAPARAGCHQPDRLERQGLAGICETLRRVDAFAPLDDQHLRRLARACSELSLPGHHHVFRRGDVSDAVFVIREGRVVVLRDQRGRPVQILARLGACSLFGELGVLHGARRGAAVRTAEPCLVLRIEKAVFLRLLKDHGATAARLEAQAARRHCRNAGSALDVDTRTDVRIRIDAEVTLVPAGGHCSPVTLEDLSHGGLSLTGAPAEWQIQRPVSFTVVAAGRPLRAAGRVAWRTGDTVGISFTEPTADHGRRISTFTRHLLEELA